MAALLIKLQILLNEQTKLLLHNVQVIKISADIIFLMTGLLNISLKFFS